MFPPSFRRHAGARHWPFRMAALLLQAPRRAVEPCDHVLQSVRAVGLVPTILSLVSMVASLRRRFGDGRIGRVTQAGGCLASTLAGAVFVMHVYGPAQIAAAARGADLWLLADAIGLGVFIQVVRAQRSRSLLAHDRPVSLSHSFASMVVGHGIGDLLPLAPGGPVLRSVLTERLAGVPVAFSGGAYMIEGTLDVIAPALLIPYILVTRAAPSWAHWALIGVGTQAILLLALLITLALHSPAAEARRVPSFVSPRLLHLGCQLAEGLSAVTAGGPRRCLRVSGLSLLVLVLMAVQLTLFLHAFRLHGSMSGLLVLLVVTLSAGSIPLKIPAFGTLSAAAALPVAGIQGPSVGGYLLVSQFLLSSQTVALALLVVGWWLVRGTRPFGGGAEPLGADPGHHHRQEQIDALQGI